MKRTDWKTRLGAALFMFVGAMALVGVFHVFGDRGGLAMVYLAILGYAIYIEIDIVKERKEYEERYEREREEAHRKHEELEERRKRRAQEALRAAWATTKTTKSPLPQMSKDPK